MVALSVLSAKAGTMTDWTDETTLLAKRYASCELRVRVSQNPPEKKHAKTDITERKLVLSFDLRATREAAWRPVYAYSIYIGTDFNDKPGMVRLLDAEYNGKVIVYVWKNNSLTMGEVITLNGARGKGIAIPQQIICQNNEYDTYVKDARIELDPDNHVRVQFGNSAGAPLVTEFVNGKWRKPEPVKPQAQPAK